MIPKEIEDDLLVKYNYAIDNKFYLEGIAIIFHLLELRTRSIITSFTGKNPGNRVKIKKSIQRIKKNKKNHPSLGKHFQADLTSKVLKWKDTRDELMHHLVNDDLENYDVDVVAQNGLDIYKEFTAAHKAWLSEFNHPMKL
ncbi:TPA: hypothetical protein ACSP1Y_004816 [Aeromonas hydrophila]|uniref:hypothetical protein n=1 Tax=Aeromonas hydrophila TaxID=644 RepID=UPI0038D1369A